MQWTAAPTPLKHDSDDDDSDDDDDDDENDEQERREGTGRGAGGGDGLSGGWSEEKKEAFPSQDTTSSGGDGDDVSTASTMPHEREDEDKRDVRSEAKGITAAAAAAAAAATTTTTTSRDGGRQEDQQKAEHQEEEEEKAEDKRPREKAVAVIRRFKFSTELFFLTHRALQVIISPLQRRYNKMQERVHDIAAQAGVPLSSDNDDDAFGKAAMFQEISSAVHIAWCLEGFGGEAIAGLSCQFADFTAAWIRHHVPAATAARRRILTVSSPSYASRSTVSPSSSTRVMTGGGAPNSGGGGKDGGEEEGGPGAFVRVLPMLVETTCKAWIGGALASSPSERILSAGSAAGAAQFCGELMEWVRE